MRGLIIVSVALTVLFSLVSVSPVEAGTRTVRCGNGADLQAAIDRATSGDTLVIKGWCRGNFSIVGKDLKLLGGGPKATLHGRWRGSTLTIDFEGVDDRSTSTVRIVGLRIKGSGGRAPGSAGITSWGELSVRRSVIFGNGGNGIGSGGSVDLRSSVVRDNAGAGLAQVGRGATIAAARVVRNGGPGVICDDQSALLVEDSRVKSNEAGGIRLGYCYATVRDSRVNLNRVAGNGGGIFVGSGPDEMNFDLIDSEVRFNRASGDGGGLYITGPLNLPGSAITGSTIERNRAGGSGGGISNSGVLAIAGSVVVGNLPDDCVGC